MQFSKPILAAHTSRHSAKIQQKYSKDTAKIQKIQKGYSKEKQIKDKEKIQQRKTAKKRYSKDSEDTERYRRYRKETAKKRYSNDTEDTERYRKIQKIQRRYSSRPLASSHPFPLRSNHKTGEHQRKLSSFTRAY